MWTKDEATESRPQSATSKVIESIRAASTDDLLEELKNRGVIATASVVHPFNREDIYPEFREQMIAQVKRAACKELLNFVFSSVDFTIADVHHNPLDGVGYKYTAVRATLTIVDKRGPVDARQKGRQA